jgi:ABC-type transport system involved in multi-copper enzyme maturation permease subunit
MVTRIAAISKNTLVELVRQKVFYILLIFALCAIGSSSLMARLSFQEEFQMLKDVCLGAMAIFTSLLAILATANFLPKDLEERTIYTLLSKPVPRYAYLLGKLGGILLLLFLFVLLMSAVFAIVLWSREAVVLAEIRSQFAGALDSEEARAAIQSVTDATFNTNLIPGIAVIFVKSALLAAMTLFVSTFSTSALFTVMVSAAIYFIGHLQATAREYWMQGMASVEWWQTLLVGIVALLFPDLQAFNLTDDVIAGAVVPLTLFLKTFALGVTYVTVYFLLSAFVFSSREL